MSTSRALLADTIPFSCVDGPGNRFVVFLQGCNFDCQACHNPQTIPLHVPHAREVSVGELVDEIRGPAPYLSGVTVSGGEATLQPAFVQELFSALRNDPDLSRLTTMVDSNGSCTTAVWDRLVPVLDGAMIDLKCFDAKRHLALTGQPNDEVLCSIRHLASLGRLEEVRLLIAPGQNDQTDLLHRTARWLVDVDRTVRVKVIGFRRHGVRGGAQQWPEATTADLERCRDLLREGGVSAVATV
jgi:pyruvate-formate lyase-activating enzyme